MVRPLANDARLWPAGTLYSSANEMARFAMALLNDGVVDGKPALPPGVVAKMRAEAAAIPTTGQRYGQGLFLTGDPAYGHGGTMTGYVASVTILPEAKLGIVVLTNGDNASPAPIENAVRAAAGQRPPATDAPPPAASSPLPAGDAYVGTFRNPRRFTVEVVRQGDGLVLKRFGRDFPMRFVAPGRFLVDLPRGGTETIAFGLGPDGRADYLQMNVWALARVPRSDAALRDHPGRTGGAHLRPAVPGRRPGRRRHRAGAPPFATAGAVVEPIGLTASGRRIRALEPGIPPVANQRRLVLVGGLDGTAESTRAVLDALTAMTGGATPSSNRRRWQVAAVPCVLPDRCDATDGAAAATASASTAAFPPEKGFFDAPEHREARFLWRWVSLLGPDLVIEVRRGDALEWRANPWPPRSCRAPPPRPPTRWPARWAPAHHRAWRRWRPCR